MNTVMFVTFFTVALFTTSATARSNFSTEAPVASPVPGASCSTVPPGDQEKCCNHKREKGVADKWCRQVKYLPPPPSCVTTLLLENSTNARLQKINAFGADSRRLKCESIISKMSQEKCVVMCPFTHEGINYLMHGTADSNFEDFYLKAIIGNICAMKSVRDC